MWPWSAKSSQSLPPGGDKGVQVLRSDHFEGTGLAHRLAPTQGFAMGLSWYPIVASDFAKASLARAIATKASHYVHSSALTFVGTAKLDSSKAKLVLFSLASIFARTVALESGASVMVLQLSDGAGEDEGSALVWYCAVVNGSVRQGSDVVLPASEAKQFLDTLAKTSESVKVWGESDAIGALGVDVDDALGWAQLFVEFSQNPQLHLLQRARRNPLDGVKSVPKGFIWLGVVALVAVLWKSSFGPLATKIYAKLTAAPQVVEQPSQLWADALQLSLSQMKLTASAAIPQLVESIGVVPLSVGEPGARWQFKSMQCDADLTRQRWLCNAAYDSVDRAATNAAFQSAARSGWGVEFQPLKKASYTFNFPLAVRPLVLNDQRTRTEHLVSTASSLQRLQPLLKESPRAMSEFSAIKIQNPSFANGQAVPPVLDVKMPFTAQIQVTGPLRTAVAMNELDRHVSWRSLRISFDPGTKPDAKSSALTMEAVGEIYAKS